jgi:preprotein translocase subunit YajC
VTHPGGPGLQSDRRADPDSPSNPTMTMLDTAVLLAAAPAKKPAATSSAWLIFVVIGAGFYFLIYRPQQRKAKAARETSKDFEVGDEVLTAGGIVGYVIDVDGDRVTLETSVGASFVVLKQYVLRKLEEAVPTEDDDEDDQYQEDEAGSSDDLDTDDTDDTDDAEDTDDTDDDSGTEQPIGKRRSSRRRRKVDGVDDSGGPEGPPAT